MSKLSTFTINKSFLRINNAPHHIFLRYLLVAQHLFYQYNKQFITTGKHMKQPINIHVFRHNRTSFCECNRFS
ncbi:DNA-binding transcriptional activator TdcR [Escherichia albertii]|nr:DNA-binding transcriptional activator TdcR [Escherichia albertii]KAF0950773.1 threonine dehydratase [Escherichia albertii]